MKSLNKSSMFHILMFIAMITWGGSWASAKLIAGSTTPEVLIFWRFLATFISFLPLIIIMKIPVKLDKKSLVQVVLGAILLVVYNKFFFLGLRTGLAGAGGVLVTTLNPLVTFVFSALVFKQSVRIKEITGLILGIAGGLILLGVWELDPNKLLSSGNIYFLTAAALWAILTINSHRASGIHSFTFSFYIYGLSTLMDFFFALPQGVFEVFSQGAAFWINIIYLSVIATTFGTTAYFFASSKLGASKASSFTFLVPFSAVLISWLILNEVPKISTIIGGILALSAVYLINMPNKPAEETADGSAEHAG